MALCESAYNPLNQVSKHVQGDRGFQRDRLVSSSRRRAQSFRSVSQYKHNQVASDFAQFSNSYAPFQDLATESPRPPYTPRVPVAYQPQSTSTNPWLSEFQNGSSWQKEIHLTSISYNYVQHQNATKHEQTPTKQYSGGYFSANSGSTLSNSRCTPSITFHTTDLPNMSTKCESLTGYQSLSQLEQMESLDWENIFALLDTEVQADTDSQISDLIVDQDVSVPAREPVTESKPMEKVRTRPIEYIFQDTNPFYTQPNPFEKGMEIVNNDGNLSLAALAFEAACQHNPTNFEAWRMLGSVLSEVEREENAIDALKEALQLDPSNLDIIMRLSISYTNEGSTTLAYEHLEKWLRTKYPQIPIQEPSPDDYYPTSLQSLERIKDPYLQAARLSLTNENSFDPDVQVGLGVLLFSAKQYALAADCFSAAISSSVHGTTNISSQLHLLWNRYGACLGNMDSYNDATSAYEMALAIRPNFVRARYNLGLLYYNQNKPVLAAKCTVEALSLLKIAESKTKTDILQMVHVGNSHGRLEEIVRSDEPTQMYEMLRKCCGSIFRWDLLEKVGPGMDLRLFERELDALPV